MARGLLHQKIVDELIRRQEALTLRELQDALGVPVQLLRTTLLSEFYEQREINHPEYGRITASVPRPPGLIRIDQTDGAVRYSVPMPVIQIEPEPEPIKAEVGSSYVDEKRPGLVLLVERVTATRIEGTLLNQLDDKDPLHGKPYGADAETFRKIWDRPERRAAA